MRRNGFLDIFSSAIPVSLWCKGMVFAVLLFIIIFGSMIPGITVYAATTVTSTLTEWSGNLEFNDKEVQITERVTINGDVTLTLGTNSSMFVNKGIYLPEGSSLTIRGEGIIYAGMVHKSNGTQTTELESGYCAIGNGPSREAVGDLIISGAHLVTLQSYSRSPIVCRNLTLKSGQITVQNDQSTTAPIQAESMTIKLGSKVYLRGANAYIDCDTLSIADGMEITQGLNHILYDQRIAYATDSSHKELAISRCTSHSAENNVCKWCGLTVSSQSNNDPGSNSSSNTGSNSSGDGSNGNSTLPNTADTDHRQLLTIIFLAASLVYTSTYFVSRKNYR